MLLQRRAFSFLQFCREDDEADGTHNGIDPERTVTAQRTVEEGEGIGER